MSEKLNSSADKKEILNAIFIPFVIGILMILSFVLEKGMDWDFHTAGVYPRQLNGLSGVFTLIFVHADWTHLVNNVVSFVILGSFLHYFYRQLATRIMLISYVFSGLILWVIGRESWHIGASGLIYSLAFFLFFSGIIRKHIPLWNYGLAYFSVGNKRCYFLGRSFSRWDNWFCFSNILS